MSRILIYSHNVIGIGHVRMAAKMAVELSNTGQQKCLVVSGSSHIPCPPKDSGWEIIKLPSLFKTNSRFHSATFLEASETFDLRRKMLLSVASSFNPELLIVYHSPVGLRGELFDALDYCRNHRIRTVLVLRDILNSPELTKSSWERKGYYSLVNKFYDLVVHQGEPSIFKAEHHYEYPDELAKKVVYSGYALTYSGPAPPKRTIGTIVSIGGGRVGYELFDQLLRTDELLPCPIVFLMGPLTPASIKKRLSSATKCRPHFGIFDPVAEPLPLFERSEIIIHNGGYNTTCEAIISGRPTYILPRFNEKDRECQIRAKILDGLGISRCINGISKLPPFIPTFRRLTWGGLSRLTSIFAALSEGRNPSEIKQDLSL